MNDRHAVVFIHGPWLHASSWARWVELFVVRGYAAVAPGWPGEEPTVPASRERPSALSGPRISEISEHYARIAEGLRARPVLIGHRLGGLLALTLAAEIHAAGAIAIDALPDAARVPLTRRPAARLGAVMLSRGEFCAVYGHALSREESDELYDRWAIPAPPWALADLVRPGSLEPRSGRRTTNSSRGPTLLVASAPTVSTAEDASARPGPASDVVVFADRGPSLVVDSGWQEVAESCLSWMDAQEL